MFEIGWTEIMVIGLVAVLVLKPKDYPEVMRSIGNFIAKARNMAAEFQGQFNDAMKDAKLEDVKKTIDEIRDLRNLSPVQQVRDTFVKMADEAATVRKEVEGVMTGATVGAATTIAASTATGTPADASTPPPAATAEAVQASLPLPAPDLPGPPTELMARAPDPAPANPSPTPAPAAAPETPATPPGRPNAA